MSHSRIARIRWSPLALALACAAASADTVTLTELPAPSNPVFGGSKIAADGTVVGSSLVAGNIWRWPAGQAPEDLGGQTMTVENILPLIAKRTSVIVSAYLYDDLTSGPARWTGGTDWEPLPDLVFVDSRPLGISYDGSRVVGAGGNDGGLLTPWIWDATNGQVALGLPDGVAGGQAWAVSDDGHVAAGYIAPAGNPFGSVGARWVDGAPEYLTDADGNSLGQAVACNEDCSVIVGYAGAASNQAWRWTEEDGAEYLGEIGDAPPDSTYVAIDANASATRIVGSYYAYDPAIGNVNRPFLWTPADHLQDLVRYLADNGIDYGSGFNDLVASSITPDGRKILLNGYDSNYVHHVAVITITPPDAIFADGFDVTPL